MIHACPDVLRGKTIALSDAHQGPWPEQVFPRIRLLNPHIIVKMHIAKWVGLHGVEIQTTGQDAEEVIDGVHT
jgi:hypothetical protein